MTPEILAALALLGGIFIGGMMKGDVEREKPPPGRR